MAIKIENPKGISYDGYKLRMILGTWWLLMYDGEADTGYGVGPFSYADALASAKEAGLVDVERMMGDRGR